MAEQQKSNESLRQVRHLNALLALSEAMAQEVELDQLLLTIVKKTTEVMEADRSSLFLYDSKTNELWSKIAQGLEIKEIRFPVGIGIAGDVAKTREGSNIPDAYDDPRFNQAFDKQTGYRTRSVLALPIMNTEGELVGVVQCLNKAGGTVFDEHDEQLLNALGAHMAVALERARLVEAYVEKQRMEEALKVAQNIQMSLLPVESPTVKGFDIYGYSVACDETGGDYFDYIEFPDGRLGLIIGDVSGHGLGAAMYMATARASLRSIMMTTDDLAEALRMVNDRLALDMTDEAFITLVIMILDPATGTLRYSSAGHEDPQIYRAGSGIIDELPSTGLPLGMLEDMEFPEGQPAILNEGDILLLTTDGVFEAMDIDEEQFSHPRMLQVLRDMPDKSAEEITVELTRRTYEFIGNANVRDDITIVVLKGVPVEAEETVEIMDDLGIVEGEEVEELDSMEEVEELDSMEEVEEMEMLEETGEADTGEGQDDDLMDLEILE